MELLTPDLGLIFWMTLSFILVLIILKKFAWKPILGSIKHREEYIRESIEQANQARKKLEKVKEEAEKIIEKARIERKEILKEAQNLRSRILSQAEEEGNKIKQRKLDEALQEIEIAKENAIKEIKDLVVVLSIDIAEKILSSELENKEKQKDYIQRLLKNSNLN